MACAGSLIGICSHPPNATDRPRILFVVASRHGGTTEIAGVLAQQMVGQGFAAVVADVEHVPDLATFDGVVVGSAVYLGRWLRGARRFIEDRSAELADSKVWLFSSGPLGANHESGLDADHVQWLTRTTGAVEHREFGGRLDPEDLGPFEALIARAVDAPVGDFRKWDEIRQWARDIVVTLAPLEPAVSRPGPSPLPFVAPLSKDGGKNPL